jgi:hypothetical protein
MVNGVDRLAGIDGVRNEFESLIGCLRFLGVDI